MSPLPRRAVLFVLAASAALLLASLPATHAADSTTLEASLLIVGFESTVDEPLIALNGGETVRVFPELQMAEVAVHPDHVVVFTTGMLLDANVLWVESNDPLHLDGASWDSASWDGSQWDSASWDGSQWDGSQWDGAAWDSTSWDSTSWDGSQWDGSQWDGSQWDGASWDWGAQDPAFADQWGLGAANAPDAWAHSRGTRALTICVLDTGVDPTHPDLRPALWRAPNDGAFGYNAMLGGGDVMDDVGHGTHVAGIIAAVGGNGTGITGMAQEVLLAVKVMDAEGGTEADLAEGITFCADAGADVLSMSLHVTEESKALDRAIQYAWKSGALLVAAAGNEGADAVAYPAAHPQVMAVGAVAPDATVPDFSNRGRDLSLVAPGVWIASTFPGDAYRSGSGTSQAVPFVSAAAALVWEADPTLDAREVRALLEDTARDFGPEDFDKTFGHGALDAGAAVAAARAQ